VHLELLLAVPPVCTAAVHQPFAVKVGVLFFAVGCQSERSPQLRAFVNGASSKLSLVHVKRTAYVDA